MYSLLLTQSIFKTPRKVNKSKIPTKPNQSNPIQSNPIQSNPVQSNLSNPIHFNPDPSKRHTQEYLPIQTRLQSHTGTIRTYTPHTHLIPPKCAQKSTTSSPADTPSSAATGHVSPYPHIVMVSARDDSIRIGMRLVRRVSELLYLLPHL